MAVSPPTINAAGSSPVQYPTIPSPAEPFHPSDFTPSVYTVFILWNSTPTSSSSLRHLARDLRSLHTALSELEAQAENPLSLLQSRCLDRRPEFLSLRTRMEKVLFSIHALLISPEELAESRVNVSIGKLRLNLEAVTSFVDSLGLSALGRSEEVLSRAERLLIDAVFEERTGVRRERVLRVYQKAKGRESEIERAWEEVHALLWRGGLSKSELRRWDAEINLLVIWVGINEVEVTRLRETAGLRVY